MKEARQFKDKYITLAINIGLLLMFIGLVWALLYCKYKGKLTPEEKAGRERLKKQYMFQKLHKILLQQLMFYIKGTEGSFRINRGKIVLKNLYPEIDQKDFFLFQVKSNSSKLGKIIMEMDAKNSGAPKISKLWVLDNLLPEKHVLTPVIVDFKWQDLDGNIVKGETLQDTLMFSGKVKNAGEIRDLYVHLNDKKVFYTAKLNHHDESGEKIHNNREFPFKTVINLSPGINKISVKRYIVINVFKMKIG